MFKRLIVVIFALVFVFPSDAFTLEKGEQIKIFKERIGKINDVFAGKGQILPGVEQRLIFP